MWQAYVKIERINLRRINEFIHGKHKSFSFEQMTKSWKKKIFSIETRKTDLIHEAFFWIFSQVVVYTSLK